MGGDRQSTWEHMAPNKQQAMCSTHRDIWWPAWAHQQDRDRTGGKRTGGKRTGGKRTGGKRTGGKRTGGKRTGGKRTGGK